MNCRKIIEDYGAILDTEKTGEHYKYVSGRHGGIYIEKSRLLKNPFIASQLANEIVREMPEYLINKTGIDVFLGAVVGGAKFANYVVLSYLDVLTCITAAEFSVRRRVLCIEAEKKTDEHFICDEAGMEILRYERLVLKRNYGEDIKGKKIFIVEDIINSGKTILQLIDLVVNAGGEVIGIGCIWNRGDFRSSRIPLISLVNERIESWKENDCPYCKKGLFLSRIYGHG